ncbi:hypothetical protein T10_10408 [Trichinella papuae]|uniref:Uncharacterized protein n=1 Tax=Trichinella papuae TaxID=268474 RepID=A0A0V1MGG3_9BILA|nr:hypothetical protein T10_10408 [Trichinella papuae]
MKPTTQFQTDNQQLMLHLIKSLMCKFCQEKQLINPLQLELLPVPCSSSACRSSKEKAKKKKNSQEQIENNIIPAITKNFFLITSKLEKKSIQMPTGEIQFQWIFQNCWTNFKSAY